MRSALIGGVAGAGGGYVAGGGNVPGLGSIGGELGPGGYGPPTPGSGVLGSLSSLTGTTANAGGGGMSALTGGGTGGLIGPALRAGGSIYSYGQNQDANEDIERALMQAGQQGINTLRPYLSQGLQAQQDLAAALQGTFEPGDLTQDPGYQFQLQEGQKAIDRQLASQGLGQSGAAIKAATQYSQGLADQTYQDAYNRWLSSRAQNIGGFDSLAGRGIGAAGGIANLQGDLGGVRASTLGANQQNRDRLIASLLGAFGGGDSSFGGLGDALLGGIF